MFGMKKLKLFVDLYQFLPSKRQATKVEQNFFTEQNGNAGRGRNQSKGNYNTI